MNYWNIFVKRICLVNVCNDAWGKFVQAERRAFCAAATQKHLVELWSGMQMCGIVWSAVADGSMGQCMVAAAERKNMFNEHYDVQVVFCWGAKLIIESHGKSSVWDDTEFNCSLTTFMAY